MLHQIMSLANKLVNENNSTFLGLIFLNKQEDKKTNKQINIKILNKQKRKY